MNAHGLHARPVSRFVDLACRFESEVFVTNLSRGDEAIDGKSPMYLLTLEGTKGTRLLIAAEGPDAEDAVSALAELVSRGFDDGEASRQAAVGS